MNVKNFTLDYVIQDGKLMRILGDIFVLFIFQHIYITIFYVK